MSYSDRRAANFFWWVRRWRLWVYEDFLVLRCVSFWKYCGVMSDSMCLRLCSYVLLFCYIGSRHAVSPKLGLSGPRTDINSFLPILNRSEQFEENVHFRSFSFISGHSIGHFIRHLMALRPSLRLYQS